jgi:endoglucanase
LLWAAAWLYQATNDRYYLDYLANNGDSLGGTGWSVAEFGWDVKYAGAQALATKVQNCESFIFLISFFLLTFQNK